MSEYRVIGDLTPEELQIVCARFWAKVNKAGEGGCWLWTASKRNKGYGAFAFTANGRVVQERAHRFSYELHVGPIPEGMFVLHRCDTPACVNPDHLFLGTNQDNVTDMMTKARHVPGGTYGQGEYVYGEEHHAARLTEAQVRAMRQEYAEGGISYSQLAAKYGIALGHCYRIVNRKAWRHVE